MRRIGKLSAAFALVLAACSGPGFAKPAPYVLQTGHIDLNIGPDGNTVILDAPQGLVVIDTGRHPAHSARIAEHARKVGKPVIAVVNTHWHLDHTTGNRDLLKHWPRARIVASGAVEGALGGFLARSRDGARKRLAEPKLDAEERQRIERGLAAMEDRAALVPVAPVERDGVLKLGGRKIEMHLARNAATEGDLWLVVPDEKLVVAGDLVVGAFPFFDTGCEKGWSQALDSIAKTRWTTLIPGHGAPMDRAAFGRWHAAFRALLDCARSDRKGADCAAGWERDAAGFYTEGERAELREMGIYYVDQVLRAPVEKRMAYCRAG